MSPLHSPLTTEVLDPAMLLVWDAEFAALHIPPKHRSHILFLLRDRGIETPDELRDLLELYRMPVGMCQEFPGFTQEDFDSDLRSAREKLESLLAVRAMVRSHHIEPWNDPDM